MNFKNLISRLAALVIACCLTSHLLHGQIPFTPPNVLSPNAASLGMYGQIPVSLFTGLPQIDIPLYEINEGPLKVPVSLSYHASGVRPDQHPGWVGMNWSLQCGGVISRIVKDLPDESDFPKLAYGSKMGYFYNRNILNTSQWSSISAMQNIARGDESLKDTEPDEFNFSLPGYTGSFFWDATGVWKVKCDKPITVIFDGTYFDVPFSTKATMADYYGYSRPFSGFILVTEDGTRYTFGKNANAIEYSMPFFSQYNGLWTAGSWYLTKIQHPSGKEINFLYERGNLINQMGLSVYLDLGTYVKGGGIFSLTPGCSSNSGVSEMSYYYNGSLISPVYLTKVTFTNGDLTFKRVPTNELRYEKKTYDTRYSDWIRNNLNEGFLPVLENYLTSMPTLYPECLSKLQWNKLDVIEINDSQKNQKSYKLIYNANVNERLRLDRVTQSANGQTLGAYFFGYDASEDLPPYLSNKTDHWGFYNGTYASLDDLNAYYSKREPNATYLLAGILNRITYPTGGYTRFEFEPHRYCKQLKINRWDGCVDANVYNVLAGGLRIKTISSYPSGAEGAQVKTYSYSIDYPYVTSSSGVLGGQIKYYFDDFQVNAFNNKNATYKKSIFSSQSVLPGCINSTGSHIGYTNVTEILADGSYSKFTYSNFDNGYLDEPFENTLIISRSAYEEYNSKEQERGKLLQRIDYDKDKKMVKKEETVYSALNKGEEFVRAVRASYKNVCPDVGVCYEEGTAYKNYTYSFLPTQTTKTIYDSSEKPIGTEVVTYSYNNNRTLKEQTVVDSRNRKQTTTYRYLNDVYPTSATTNNDLQGMRNAGMIGVPLEIVKKQFQDANGAFVGSEVNSYKVINKVPLPYQKFVLEEGVANYQPYLATSSLIMDTRLRAIFTGQQYDVKNNLIQYIDEKGVVVSYLWGYNGAYPVLKVLGASYNDVIAKLTAAELTNISTSKYNEVELRNVLNKIRTAYSGNKTVQVFTYTYESLVGITSETDPAGIITYYEYDLFGRLQRTLDNNSKSVKQYEYYYKK